MYPHLIQSSIADIQPSDTPQLVEDYCCRADSASAVVSTKLQAVTTLIEELARTVADPIRKAPLDYLSISTPRLVAHIVSTHHEFLRRSFASLRTLAAKVRRGHGDKNPRLRELEAAVNDLADLQLPHLEWEEETLFPLLTAKSPNLDQIRAEVAAQPDTDLHASQLLQKILYASDDFTPPKWACVNYLALMSQLMHLEGDLYVHSHLEDQVLIPRFTKK